MIVDEEKRVPPYVASDVVGDHDPAESPGRLARVLSWAHGHRTVVGTIAASGTIILMQTGQGMILARILGKTGRGEYATAILYTTALTYIGLAGTMYAVTRRAAREPARSADLRRTSLRLGSITGLATMAVVAFLAMVALPADKRYLTPLCIACALALPSEHIRLLLLAVDQGSGRFGRYNVSQIFSAMVFPIFLLIAWRIGGASVKSIALMTIVVPIVGLAFRRFLGDPWNPLQAGYPTIGRLLAEGKHYAVSVIVADLLVGRLDMLMMCWLAGFASQGLYAVAVPTASLLFAIPNALAMFAFNAGARHDQSIGLRNLLIAAGGFFAFQIVTAAVFSTFVGFLIVLLFGNEFQGAIPFALALLPAQTLQGCITLADGYLRGRNRPASGVQSRTLSASIMVVATLTMLPRYHALSIPLGASIGAAVGLTWMTVALVRDALRDGRKGLDSKEAAL